MASHSPRPSSTDRRLLGDLPKDSRYEIAFEKHGLSRWLSGDAWAGLSANLASLTGRVGEVVGEGYARTAALVRRGVERFEDAAAERRFREQRRSEK